MEHKKALFMGTFDPPTCGHLDIILRAASLCDTLYIGIAQNNSKRETLFSPEERRVMLQSLTKKLPQTKVFLIPGLVVDFAKKEGISFFIRGLRNFSDFETEAQMAFTNQKIGGIETLFLIADEKYARLSSSLIREIALLGHRLDDFIPAEIEEEVFTRLKSG